MDLPTSLEANLVSNFFAKVAWVFSYLAVYGLRPLIVRPKPMGEALFTAFRGFPLHLKIHGHSKQGHVHSLHILVRRSLSIILHLRLQADFKPFVKSLFS